MILGLKYKKSQATGRSYPVASLNDHCLFRVSVDASLLSNIQKLFSERIEIFTSVEFTKVSVLTGIIKIALKVSFQQNISEGEFPHI